MNNIVAWACDFSKTSGEGKLARDFVNRFCSLHKVNFYVHTPDIFSIKIYKKKFLDIKKKKRSSSAFLHRFIFPTWGIFFLLFNYYFKKKKIAYINYCPLWNILIFALLPKNCVLGPITGSNIFYRKNSISILKFILTNPLYKISLGFIKIKKWALVLSTNILVSVFEKNKYFNYFENYFFLSNLKKNFFLKTKYKKDIDLLIYFRLHYNKDNLFFSNIIKKLAKHLNIHVFGDYINSNEVVNHGQISNKTVFKLLKRTKFTIASSDNIYSIFCIEALRCSVRIFYNGLLDKQLLKKYRFFYPIDFLSVNNSFISILRILKKYKFKKKYLQNIIVNKLKINLFLKFVRY